jgi:predicted nucleic acid-binding protein
MIVLDTNVLSELMRLRPEPAVEAWLGAQPTASLFIPAITQAEILYGLALLPEGRRRTDLLAAATSMFEEDFGGRILPFDSDAAVAYGDIAADRRKAGRPISQFDAQIAAIVQSRGGVLATRNIADFVDCGIEVVDPWPAESPRR